jgi:hypothetical protein
LAGLDGFWDDDFFTGLARIHQSIRTVEASKFSTKKGKMTVDQPQELGRVRKYSVRAGI